MRQLSQFICASLYAYINSDTSVTCRVVFRFQTIEKLAHFPTKNIPSTQIDSTRMISIEDRVRYYTRGVSSPVEVTLTPDLYNLRYYDLAHDPVLKRVMYPGDRSKTVYTCVAEARAKVFQPFQRYFTDLSRDLDPRVGVLVAIGDVASCLKFPCIAKTRPVSCDNNVLLPLDDARHMTHVARMLVEDIPFDDKDDRVVWRGGRTGVWNFRDGVPATSGRQALLERHASNAGSTPHIDVGLAGVPEGSTKQDLCKRGFVKEFMSVESQMRSKFVISAQGNDVATNLKYLLASNSVPIMVRPTVCSWVMEDRLRPWVHYLPVAEDYSDLEDTRAWGAEHPEECRRIAAAGREYVTQFLDEDRERDIARRVVDTWRRNVTLVSSSSDQEFGEKVENVKRAP